MIWILSGALAALFIRNHFDTQGVSRDIRRIARSVRKMARELARTVRQAVREEKKEDAETRETVPEQVRAAMQAHETQPEQAEMQQNSRRLKEPEQKTGVDWYTAGAEALEQDEWVKVISKGSDPAVKAIADHQDREFVEDEVDEI